MMEYRDLMDVKMLESEETRLSIWVAETPRVGRKRRHVEVDVIRTREHAVLCTRLVRPRISRCRLRQRMLLKSRKLILRPQVHQDLQHVCWQGSATGKLAVEARRR